MGSELTLDFEAAPAGEADARIKEFLVGCVEGFFSQYPPDKVASQVLTGAMTRGEGSCEVTEEGAFVYSDFDLLVVLEDHRDFLEAQSVFPVLARTVTDELREKGLRSHVDFAPITREYFRSMGPSMFNVEVAEHGKVVWGDRDIMHDLNRPDPTLIPVDDALVLLFNRTASHLSMADTLRTVDDAEFPFAFYHNGKIFLDIVSCILVLEHRYEPTYRGRLDQLSRLSDGYSSRIPSLVEDASFWTEYKLDPKTSRVIERYSSSAGATGKQGVGIFLWNLLVPKIRVILEVCAKEATDTREPTLRSSLEAYLARKSLLRRMRERRWFVRRFGRDLESGTLRGPLSCLRGSPLDMAYATLALLLFSVEELGRDQIGLMETDLLEEAASFLPVVISESDEPLARWRKMRDAATEVWRLAVKGGAY